ncbi:MAG TPA: proteasome activator, partial [Streptosporangiaceae bacterium]
GWLEGLFHGIQTTLFAQQMAARAQLEQMRRALPPGMMPGQEESLPQQQRASGPYL